MVRWTLGCVASLALLGAPLDAWATSTDGVVDPCTPGPVSGAENETFKDVLPSSVGSAEANALYVAGITSGCSASPLLFCPTCEISRGAFAVFLVRAAKLTLLSPSQPTFVDVPASHPFYKEVETAAAAGFASPCSTGNFCPDAPVTRAAGATMVAKAAGLKGSTPSTPSFSDVPASHGAFVHVEALKTNCVTTGCKVGEFCPDTEMVRAQAAVFVAKAFDVGDVNPCLGSADAGSDAATSDAATGGSGGSAGSSAGGSPGSGGAWDDSGILPLDAGGTGGSSSAKAEGGDDGGCGCSVPGGRSETPAVMIGAVVLAAARARRRRVRPAHED